MTDLEIARQWIMKAQNDLLNADNNLRSERIPFDTVCFHCQQAAEKYLKAVIYAKGSAVPLTHDLILLLEKILVFRPDAEILREPLALLNPFAVEVRYPDDWFMPTEEDTQEARNVTEQVASWVKKSFPQLF